MVLSLGVLVMVGAADPSRALDSLRTAKVEAVAKGHEQALYAALASHFASLQPGEVERLDMFERTDARQALKLLGAEYVRLYPHGAHVEEVELNIGRAFYEDGEYEEAATKLEAFVLGHPTHPNAPQAGELAFDALNELRAYDRMVKMGEAFAHEPRLPAKFVDRAKGVAREARTMDPNRERWLDAPDGRDLLDTLLETADARRGTEAGEKALFDAFRLLQDRNDLARRDEIAARLLREYPTSSTTAAVLQVQGHDAALGARFADAAKLYEELGRRFTDSTGVEAFMTAARLQAALGNTEAAVRAYEAAGPRKVEALVAIAQLRAKSNEPAKARALAEQVLKADRTNAGAALVIAELFSADPNARFEDLAAVLTPMVNSPSGQSEEAAKAMFLLGDMMFRRMRALPELDEKVALMQQTQGVLMQVTTAGAPEWSIAALWRIGGALTHIADTVETMRPPADLPATRLVEFHARQADEARALREQAGTLFTQCSQRAESLDVVSTAAMGCRLRAVDAESPLPAASPARAVDVSAWRGKTDAASLEAMGVAYLGAGQVKLAQLTLARAIELEELRASAHSALGWALLLDGDAMGAMAEYRRALLADPKSVTARANLAGLECRFKDPSGSRAELSLLEGGTAGVGPAVDPLWAACR